MHEEIHTIVLRRGEEAIVEESFESELEATEQLRKQVEQGVGNWERINPTLYVRDDKDEQLEIQKNNLYRKDPRKR